MPNTSSSDSPNVVHNETESRFEVKLEDDSGILLYEMVDDVMDILSVQVPPAHRKRGIGSAIAKAALDYARDNDLRVIPTCPFVQSFIRDNAEYGMLVTRTV